MRNQRVLELIELHHHLLTRLTHPPSPEKLPPSNNINVYKVQALSTQGKVLHKLDAESSELFPHLFDLKLQLCILFLLPYYGGSFFSKRTMPTPRHATPNYTCFAPIKLLAL